MNESNGKNNDLGYFLLFPFYVSVADVTTQELCYITYVLQHENLHKVKLEIIWRVKMQQGIYKEFITHQKKLSKSCVIDRTSTLFYQLRTYTLYMCCIYPETPPSSEDGWGRDARKTNCVKELSTWKGRHYGPGVEDKGKCVQFLR